MVNSPLISFLQVSNEAITATAVIIAASLLLYNLSHGIVDRVVRSSSVVLGCVTAAYIGDVFVALGSGNPFSHVEAWLRFQWIGIAFAPAALFHLSDALLETTGLASRGRRKRVVRILYLFGIVFLLTATGTDLIIHDRVLRPIAAMQPGPLFGLYLLYFGLTLAVSFNNVLRARRRCLTSVTHRRMTYLLLSFLMPAAGIFPYSLILSQASDSTVWVLLLINLGNVAVVLMLAFMAYPLAFFGQSKPDRVIKSDLLRFFLRGPATAIIVLMVILFLPATRLLGLPGVEFLPFVAVAAVLIVQWAIAVLIPYLDRWLVYGKDQEDARQLRELGEHLLTKADARQLLEAILAATCDYLRTPSAFIVSLNGDGPKLESSVGSLLPAQSWLASSELSALVSALTEAQTPIPEEPALEIAGMGFPPERLDNQPEGQSNLPMLPDGFTGQGDLITWGSFWLVPLRSVRPNGHTDRLIGLMGVWARSPQPDLDDSENDVFTALYKRAARVLDDALLQQEIFGTLKGLLPEIEAVQQLPGAARYGNAPALAQPTSEAVRQPDFTDLIRDALRDYWGGARLTESRLLQLTVVQRALAENDGNPARAVRAVLSKAIESLRPEGQRLMTTEWILYNVLDMRFVQGRKVLDVADKLAMSEANVHRKQRVAIEQVAQKVAEMERETVSGNGTAK